MSWLKSRIHPDDMAIADGPGFVGPVQAVEACRGRPRRDTAPAPQRVGQSWLHPGCGIVPVQGQRAIMFSVGVQRGHSPFHVDIGTAFPGQSFTPNTDAVAHRAAVFLNQKTETARRYRRRAFLAASPVGSATSWRRNF